MIAVDLPGHGDSDTPSADEDLSHTETVLKMRKVVPFLFYMIGVLFLLGDES